MAHSFLGRISRPYEEIKELLATWAHECERMWVYQHDADDAVERTHCHLLCLNSKIDVDAFKERKSWKNTGFKGNKDSSFKKYDPIYELNYITYMSKGNLEPVYTKGDTGEAEHWKSQWTSSSPKVQTMIQLVEEKVKHITEYDLALWLEVWSQENPQEEDEEFSEYKKRLILAAVKICKQYRKMAHYRRIVGMVQHVAFQCAPKEALKKCMYMI